MSEPIAFLRIPAESMFLPLMSLREVVMFPKAIVPLFLSGTATPATFAMLSAEVATM